MPRSACAAPPFRRNGSAKIGSQDRFRCYVDEGFNGWIPGRLSTLNIDGALLNLGRPSWFSVRRLRNVRSLEAWLSGSFLDALSVRGILVTMSRVLR